MSSSTVLAVRDLRALGFAAPTPEQMARAESLEQQRQAERAAEDCDQAARAIRRAHAALPARYALDLHDPAIRRRVGRPEAVAESLEAVGRTSAVWIGKSGSGKSTLACAAARLWAERRGGGRIVFARASTLATASRYHALGEGAPPALRAAAEADLLILDELGDALATAQWDDVTEVVFRRYEEHRATWVTTWLAATEVAQKYGDGFARRIFERARVVQCGGVAP